MKEEDFISYVRHIAWISFQIADGQSYNLEMNGDQFQSLLDGIKFIQEHPDVTPEENHENWMHEKMYHGWKFGTKKDFKKKTHPDIIPYNKLPEIEKRKDIADIIIHREAEKLWLKLKHRLK